MGGYNEKRKSESKDNFVDRNLSHRRNGLQQQRKHGERGLQILAELWSDKLRSYLDTGKKGEFEDVHDELRTYETRNHRP